MIAAEANLALLSNLDSRRTSYTLERDNNIRDLQLSNIGFVRQ